MAAFQKVREFNEELQRKIKRLEWNIEERSYEDLKKNPSAYSFYETKDYMRFFVKERTNGRIRRTRSILIITATAYDASGSVRITSESISHEELNFLNRTTKDNEWWL